MENIKIAFVGAGNMANAMIGGLLQDNWNPDNIMIADPDAAQRERTLACYSVHSTDNNADALAFADIVVLSVKPQVMQKVISTLVHDSAAALPLFISIAAGVRTDSIAHWIGGDARIIRVMPNTPAMVQSGASVLYARPDVSADYRNIAESIMRSVGLAIWVDDESAMDAVTALSGSGPAYLFLVMEALQEAGEKLGLPKDVARLLAVETSFGASKMALEINESPASLREKVTSPGGTTERALEILEQGNFKQTLIDAIAAAEARSKELAKMLGEQ